MRLTNLIISHPIFLVHNDIENVEYVDKISTLQNVTNQSIKEKSLIGCWIVLENKQVYRITEILDIGRLHKSNFLNWLTKARKIDLILNEETEEDLINKIFLRVQEYKLELDFD